MGGGGRGAKKNRGRVSERRVGRRETETEKE